MPAPPALAKDGAELWELRCGEGKHHPRPQGLYGTASGGHPASSEHQEGGFEVASP